MTNQELLCYQMNPQEIEKWQQLCRVIRQKFATLQLPEVAYEELEKQLQPGTPYTYVKGYTESDGYFHVEAGDRGSSYLIFKTTNRQEAEEQIIKSLAHDVSYRYVVNQMEQIELQNRGHWRFYKVVDGREPDRIISHEEENKTWKYDAKYDYRKYWFELALYILKYTVSQQTLVEEVQRYEDLLNRRLEASPWKYDLEKEEFIMR